MLICQYELSELDNSLDVNFVPLLKLIESKSNAGFSNLQSRLSNIEDSFGKLKKDIGRRYNEMDQDITVKTQVKNVNQSVDKMEKS